MGFLLKDFSTAMKKKLSTINSLKTAIAQS